MLTMLEAGACASNYMPSPLSVDVGAGAHRLTKQDTVLDETLGQGQPVVPRIGDAPRIKVLVVDDEHIIANTLSIILNISGFEALAVYSGEAAVQALGSFQPDVLISDVVMNGMSGIEAALIFRTQCPQCRILLFSGQAGAVDLLHYAREQGQHFEIMAKPIHPSDLLAKLRAGSIAPNTFYSS